MLFIVKATLWFLHPICSRIDSNNIHFLSDAIWIFILT